LRFNSRRNLDRAPLDRADIARTREIMAEASRIVLGGFEIRTDVKVFKHPERFTDGRGVVMWQRVMGLIAQRQRTRGAA
jgi:DNA polymerase I